MIDNAISKLVAYCLQKGLILPNEILWAINTILDVLKLDGYTESGESWDYDIELAPVLDELLNDAHARGVLAENSVVYRDLFDTELMGRLTPRPAQVIHRFKALYQEDPKKATDWYYAFSQDTNYIRRDRIAKDMQWKAPTEYGELDITINLSKPEKDPKAIAAAKNLPASAYPRCQLCAENEGYAGRVNHPARQNHRIVPITINGSPWFLQYSPYVYY
ncbi:MAG: galactose-1-phosphate uridylyltransferase, partial [Lawsonibacter sp.]|nr:galactose-1-phosphate uridylyltransferase [Lawsonibacter sp.]